MGRGTGGLPPRRPDQQGSQGTVPLSPGGLSIAQLIQQGLLTNADMIALGLATEATQLTRATEGTTQAINSTLGSPSQDATTAAIPGGIFSTGVPLYSKSVIFAQKATTSVGPGGVSVIGPAAIPQIGYEVSFTVKCPAGTFRPFFNVQLTWTDSVSGAITSQERWTLAVGSGTGITYYGSGPTKGDVLEIDFTNPDSVATMTYSGVIVQNSRPYARDDWRQQNVDTVTNLVYPSVDSPMNILGSSQPIVAAGNNTQRILPLYAGKVFLSAQSINSAAFVSVSINDPVVFPSTTPTIYQAVLGNGSGLGINQTITLPRCPCTIFMSNTGGASTTFQVSLIIEEY